MIRSAKIQIGTWATRPIRTIALALIFQGLWIAPSGSTSQNEEDLDIKLNTQLSNYNPGVFNFVEALVHISTEFQVPMGIVWVNTPSTRAKLSFAWKKATVRDVIEAIIKTQSGYSSQIRNGVVHISPSGSLPERQNFLKLKLKSFEVHNEYYEVASLKLHDLITPPRYAGISIGANIEPTITLQLKDTTVEGVLDGLALASTRKIWTVAFSDDTRLTALGFRRAMSLWRGIPVPDKDQPVWELLHWGDKLPTDIGVATRD